MKISVITAVGMYVAGKGYPIGKDGKIPWDNKSDMKWFKETTTGHSVIMGLNTWMSIGRPLKDRFNIVINPNDGDSPFGDVYYVKSFEEGVKLAESVSNEWGNELFVIGGGFLYKYVVDNGLADKLYIDYLAESVPDADTFFPHFETDEYQIEANSIVVEPRKAYALVYNKKKNIVNNVDDQYLKLAKDIIENGEIRETRSGKVRSVFSRQLRFNLKEGLPILTTKKVYTKGIIHELLWFIKGDTNIKYLVDNNVHIWDDDAYRYYLELMKINGNESALPKEEFISKVGEETWLRLKNDETYRRYRYGDLNRVYGAQWTSWGGHNQIQEVIDTLKTNPDDRRMIISAWNVADIPNMALPPCHYSCQFYAKKMNHEERLAWAKENLNLNPLSYFVDFSDEDLDKHNVPKRKLSCVWHQRSCDYCAGIPYNIGSYAIFTHLIAHCVNMDVDELIFDGGDVHIYENHISGIKEQMANDAHKYGLPKLVLNKEKNNILDFKYEDIKIEDYESYPPIKYQLNVGL